MAARMSSLLLVTIFATGVLGSPFQFGGDFGVGGTSRTDAHVGLGGEVGLKGKALSATVAGSGGVNWDGGAHGGVHTFFNDEIGAGGVLNGKLGAQIDHTHNVVVGLTPKGKAILAGSVDASKIINAGLTGRGLIATGPESRSLPAMHIRYDVHRRMMRYPWLILCLVIQSASNYD